MPNPYITIDGKRYTRQYLSAGRLLLTPISDVEIARNREAWARDIMRKASSDVVFSRIGTTTYAIHERSKRVGTAKCMPTDRYNETIGKAIAYCHLTSRKVPDYM